MNNKDTQLIWEALYGHEFYSDDQIDSVIDKLKTAEKSEKLKQSDIQLAFEISEKEKDPYRDELNRFIKKEGYYLAYLPGEKNLDYVLIDTKGKFVENKFDTADEARDFLYEVRIMKSQWYNSGQYE